MKEGSSKAISIFISLIAVTISCLSWWESRQSRFISDQSKMINEQNRLINEENRLINERNRLMNEEVNRPIFTFVRIDHELSQAEGKGREVVYPSVILKNTGKITAKINDFRWKPLVFNKPNGCELIYAGISLSPSTNPMQPPGAEQTFFCENYKLTPECAKSPTLDVTLFITIDYTDEVSGKQYSQKFVEGVDFFEKKK
jgi:hypothetical protein